MKYKQRQKSGSDKSRIEMGRTFNEKRKQCSYKDCWAQEQVETVTRFWVELVKQIL